MAGLGKKKLSLQEKENRYKIWKRAKIPAVGGKCPERTPEWKKTAKATKVRKVPSQCRGDTGIGMGKTGFRREN